MKYIVCADLHLRAWNDNEYNEEGIPLKLIEILNTFDNMCTYATTNNISNVILAGDLNDTKGTASVSAFVMFRNIIEKYPDIMFHIIHGNHDAVSRENKQSAIQLLESTSNVQLFLKPYVNDNILYMPYSHDLYGNFKEVLEDSNPNILIGHFGLNEGILANGISRKGDIKLSDLRNFKLCICGHYHKPQEISSNETKFYYVGSPVPIRRDEASDVKRFLVFNSETLEVISIPTSGYRKYHEFIIDEQTDLKSLQEQITNIKESGDFLLIKNKMKNIPKELKQLSDQIGTIPILDLYEDTENVRGITSGMSENERFMKYLEIKQIPKEDIENYLSIGFEITNFQA